LTGDEHAREERGEPMSVTPSTSTGPDCGTDPFGGNGSRTELPTAAHAGRENFRTSVINLDRPGDPSVFGERVRADAAELISRYPAGQERSALLPLLHLVQSEQGYVTPDGIAFCADALGITKAQVAAVATFYTMYKRSPTGEFLVSVCTNTLCGTLGGDDIFAALKQHLGVGNNQTTPDGRITLEHAECLAACDYAPVVTVNYEFFDNQTVGSARNVVSQLQSGERPLPTEAGVKLAIKLGHTAPSYSIDASGPAQGELPVGQDAPADAPAPRKRAPRKTAAKKTGAADQPTSEHDAPLQTSGSDEANPAKPAGEEAK